MTKPITVTEAHLQAALRLLDHSDEISGLASLLRALSPTLHKAFQEGLLASRRKNQQTRAALRSQLIELHKDPSGEEDFMHQPLRAATNDGAPPAQSLH